MQRYLDCAVVNHIHSINKRDKRKPFETVRGVFFEGKPIYDTSGFYEKTHIQNLCPTPTQHQRRILRAGQPIGNYLA